MGERLSLLDRYKQVSCWKNMYVYTHIKTKHAYSGVLRTAFRKRMLHTYRMLTLPPRGQTCHSFYCVNQRRPRHSRVAASV